MGKKILFILLGCLLITNNFTYAQVGINTQNPNPKTALEVTASPNDASQGIMIPRVTEAQRDAILTGMDAAAKNAVNSIMVFNTDEDCYNFWNVEEGEWKSVCGSLGKAVIAPINCSDIAVFGTYVEGTEVNSSNYLSVTIDVTKAGAYTISFTTTNGYSFYLSSVALVAGTQTIMIPSQGKPINVGTDVLTINGADLVAGCVPTVTVASAVAPYSLVCSNTSVIGDYFKGQALTSANYINIGVNVDGAGSYSISTNTVSGIRFSATGEFTAAQAGTLQVIRLNGSGTPTVNSSIVLTITANTLSGNATCEATVPIILPAMTYAIIGSGDYSWAYSARRAALSNGSSFGINGTVRVRSFDQLWTTTSATTAANNLNATGTTQPDIVLYFAYGANPTTDLSNALASYINKGGVVIYGSSDNTADAVNLLLNGVFGIQTAYNRSTASNQNVYQIQSLPSDPIVNGPFGNLSGRFWGEDNSGSVFVTTLPANSVQICSANNNYSNISINPTESMVWYNESKNFVYFGDSVAGTTSLGSSTTGWPAYYTTAGVPLSKPFGYWNSNTAGSQYVYNAALELNCVAWGIKKAAVSGINPH